jgi:hypothetical protein
VTDISYDPPICARCGEEYLVEFGDELDESGLCHGCVYAALDEAKAEIERLRAEVADLEGRRAEAERTCREIMTTRPLTFTLQAAQAELDRWKACARSLGRVHHPEDLTSVALGLSEARTENDRLTAEVAAMRAVVEAARYVDMHPVCSHSRQKVAWLNQLGHALSQLDALTGKESL